VDSLEQALKVANCASIMDSAGAEHKKVIRAGVIQNFEFTYELCWKFMQRWLKENQPGQDVDFPRSRNDLFRMAASVGLIADPQAWFDYGDARNLTAHTYSEDKAETVFAAAKKFLADARYFRERLEQRNDRP